jgi:hypothetical protein
MNIASKLKRREVNKMSILLSIILIALIVAVGISLFRIIIFGIGVVVVLALFGLAVSVFASSGLAGSLIFLLYLMIKLFTILLVVSIVAGIIVWIKNILVANY